MQHVSAKTNINKNLKNLPLIIGHFDCIHKGHKKLFQYVEKNKFNVLTFINSPKKLNNNLSSYNQRIEMIGHYEPKNIFIYDILRYNIDPEEFENEVLKRISPSEIIVGQNFRYGKNRKGTITSLSKKFKTRIVRCSKKHQTKEIIKNIKQNKWSKVRAALERPINFEGVVIHGQQLGRKLGYPTANIIMKEKYVELVPGVYSGYTFVDCIKIPSAIFVRPKKTTQTIETHILKGFNKDIYGKKIKVEIKKFVKKPKIIKSKHELANHIKILVKKIAKSF